MPDEDVCFVLGAGVAGVDPDSPGVVVLNAAIRMAWVMNLVWMSRTC